MGRGAFSIVAGAESAAALATGFFLVAGVVDFFKAAVGVLVVTASGAFFLIGERAGVSFVFLTAGRVVLVDAFRAGTTAFFEREAEVSGVFLAAGFAAVFLACGLATAFLAEGLAAFAFFFAGVLAGAFLAGVFPEGLAVFFVLLAGFFFEDSLAMDSGG
ncbi:MAG: hypothetical protein R3F07_06430 [Opitutaceae bacterium]